MNKLLLSDTSFNLLYALDRSFFGNFSGYLRSLATFPLVIFKILGDKILPLSRALLRE